MTGTEAANAILDTAARLEWLEWRRQIGAFLNAAWDLDEQTRGADAFAVEFRATLEIAYETRSEQHFSQEIAQAERDYRREVLGEE